MIKHSGTRFFKIFFLSNKTNQWRYLISKLVFPVCSSKKISQPPPGGLLDSISNIFGYVSERTSTCWCGSLVGYMAQSVNYSHQWSWLPLAVVKVDAVVIAASTTPVGHCYDVTDWSGLSGGFAHDVVFFVLFCFFNQQASKCQLFQHFPWKHRGSFRSVCRGPSALHGPPRLCKYHFMLVWLGDQFTAPLHFFCLHLHMTYVSFLESLLCHYQLNQRTLCCHNQSINNMFGSLNSETSTTWWV